MAPTATPKRRLFEGQDLDGQLSPTPNKKPRKGRVSLSIQDRVDIIKEKSKGLSDDQIAMKRGLSRSTVTKLLGKKDHILQESERLGNLSPKVFAIQKSPFHVIEKAVWKWFQHFRNQGLPVSGEAIKHQALVFYNEFVERGTDLPDFSASNGWLLRFQQRYEIGNKRLHGEANSADLGIVESGRQSLKDLLQDYDLEKIYNADETGLFFRLGPCTTLASLSDNSKGSKKDKNRLTVLFCCNATGSRKLKPLVIGKSAVPCDMKGINFETLKVTYRNNTKAWMVGPLWREWVKWVDGQVEPDSVLVVDNCPAHVSVDDINLKNLKVNIKTFQLRLLKCIQLS